MKINAQVLLDGIKNAYIENDDGGYLKARSYSGRSMYGAHCVGVTVDDMGQLFELFAELRQVDGLEDLSPPVTDSMGLGIIGYWPRVEWPEGAKDEDDEELE